MCAGLIPYENKHVCKHESKVCMKGKHANIQKSYAFVLQTRCKCSVRMALNGSLRKSFRVNSTVVKKGDLGK